MLLKSIYSLITCVKSDACLMFFNDCVKKTIYVDKPTYNPSVCFIENILGFFRNSFFVTIQIILKYLLYAIFDCHDIHNETEIL